MIVADGLGWLGTSTVAMVTLAAFYAAGCLGLYLLRRSGGPVPWILPWGSALLLACCLFVLYGIVLAGVALQNLVEAPSRAGMVLLFLNGPVTAAIVSAVMAYPLAVLYGRGAGVMAVVIALPVFAFYASGLIEAGFGRLSSTIMAFEAVSLYVALRTVPLLAVRVMRGRL